MPVQRLRPVDQLSVEHAAGVHTLITDIDDTVTTDGHLTAAAYLALERLHQSGLRVIVTTGRPAGWCDHIARMWPVDAVVGENGAAYFWFDSASRKLKVHHHLNPAQRQEQSVRLQAVAQQVLEAVPGCALASDQFCRLYDLAIDYCEDVARLDPAAVATIVQIMQAAGMTAKVSSIHVNGWFGAYDKLSMSREVMRDLFGLDLLAERERVIYVGDSPNDAPMFGYFPLSVGVANVRDFQDQMSDLPTFVTRARSGQGFAELADQLLAQRAGTGLTQGGVRR